MAEGTMAKLTDRVSVFSRWASGKDLFFHSSAVQGVSFDDLREPESIHRRSRTKGPMRKTSHPSKNALPSNHVSGTQLCVAKPMLA